MSFSFNILKTKQHARAGEIMTTRGVIKTPIFMPVGTVGSVKAVSPDEVLAAGAQVILGNTYHLHLRPGDELLAQYGGLHKFMKWDGPILTDSGGFQVFSLGVGKEGIDSSHIPVDELSKEHKNLYKNASVTRKAEIDEDGVTFYSHLDGSKRRLTPEISIQIQKNIGADIIMAFDECTPDDDHEYARSAMERTHRWLIRSKDEWLKGSEESTKPYQALFGIIQGGNYKDLRLESAKFINEQDLPGIAIGGVSVGYHMDQTVEHIGWVKEVVDASKPFYTMGAGRDPQDIVDLVLSGADMFDCVAPTRLARNGALYHGHLVGESFIPGNDDSIRFESEFGKHGRLQIGNEQWKLDDGLIMEGCDCATCRAGYSRAYLRHLYKTKELLYYRLASIHNIRFMIRLCEQLREKLLS